jgi:multidrug efflux system membrane fusion protein
LYQSKNRAVESPRSRIASFHDPRNHALALPLEDLRSGMERPGKSRVRQSIELVLFVFALAGFGLGGWFLASRDGRSSHVAQAASEPERQQSAVPVFAATAEAKDFPVLIRGVGTVQAFNMVSVKSRVDGNIVQIAFTEGQFVHTGDLLVQIDPRPYQTQLAQAEANKARDQANLENARRDLARLEALVKNQLAATQQQYDTQRATVAQLEATVKSDQAQIDAAKLNITYSALTSPIDGITGLRLVDIGNLVQASSATPLVIVTQIKPIYVTFTVPERDLDRIRRAIARHPLTVLAFNGDDNKQLSQGVLKVVNNEVDQATGTVTLKAQFANQDARLWPGEFVNAHLVLEVVKDGVTVSSAAIQMGGTGPFVYLIKSDSTVEVRPVTVTDVEADTALIGKGLQAGDKIVVSGQVNLSPGAKVTVQPGSPGELVAREPEIGPEGVGSTGVTTGPGGIGGIKPR